MSRITKFKETKRGKIIIKWETKNNDEWDTFRMSCNDDARPELYNALDELAKDVVKIAELEEEDVHKKISVKGVSFSYSNDVMGAVMSAQKELKNSNAPLCFPTPHKPAEDYSEAGDNPTLPQSAVNHLTELKKECWVYIKGERKQMNVFDNDEVEIDGYNGEEKVDFETGEVIHESKVDGTEKEIPKQEETEEEVVGGEVISENYR